MWKGDPYLDPQTEILYNRLGLTDQAALTAAELLLSSQAFAKMVKDPLPGNLDQKHLQAIHCRLFEAVYYKAGEHSPAFAGEIRIIGIEKKQDVGIDYPHPDHPVESLKARLDYAFDQLNRDRSLSAEVALSDPALFTRRLAVHSAEIWECHPFRDGNTRTTLLFTDHLARSHGVELSRGPLNVAAFRACIADYVRGDRERFVGLIERMVRDELEREREREREPGALEHMPQKKAEQLLSNQSANNLELLRQAHQEKHEKLVVIRTEARQALDVFDAGRRVRSRKDKRELQRLTDAYALANRDVKRHEAQWQARTEYRVYEAMKIAKQQHPEAAQVIQTINVRAQANELSSRWQRLENKIQGLTFQGGHEAVISYRRELSDLLARIDRHAAVKAALPREVRDRVGPARQENERAIGQSLERGPERER